LGSGKLAGVSLANAPRSISLDSAGPHFPQALTQPGDDLTNSNYNSQNNSYRSNREGQGGDGGDSIRGSYYAGGFGGDTYSQRQIQRQGQQSQGQTPRHNIESSGRNHEGNQGQGQGQVQRPGSEGQGERQGSERQSERQSDRQSEGTRRASSSIAQGSTTIKASHNRTNSSQSQSLMNMQVGLGLGLVFMPNRTYKTISHQHHIITTSKPHKY
jgi:hypothetical protein